MVVNILNIAEFKVVKFEETEHDYNIRVEMVSPPSYCHHCGCVANLLGHGSKEQVFRDIPSHDRRVTIYLKRKRYRCKDCTKTFLEPLPMLDEKRLMTRRLREYIEKESLVRTFKSLSEELGLDEKTIRNVFHEHAKWLNTHILFPTPKWLGIDEAHLLHNYRCVIANVKESTIYDILEDRKKTKVIEYLKQMPYRKDVEVACMDMWPTYRDAAILALPNARIIIDKFHVVKGASEALEEIRKKIRQSLTDKQRKTLMHDRFTLLKRRVNLSGFEQLRLESWTANYPELGAAYELKEEFYDIFDTGVDRKDALERYQAWKKQMPSSMQPYFKSLMTSMKNWETEIFNYFDTPVGTRPSNAYTEALNGLIKIVNRNGRGYSFEVLRAKLLYTEGFKEISEPMYVKDLSFCGWDEDDEDSPDPDTNLNAGYKDSRVYRRGPRVSTVCKLMEGEG